MQLEVTARNPEVFLFTNLQGTGYDGENRLATGTVNGATTTYWYDGEGRRVVKVAAGGAAKTVFVYDAFGQLAAEYEPSAPVLECTTCFLLTDHLGSTRAVLNAAGDPVSLHDYYPFGEEVQQGVGDRGALYAGGLRLKFTGKERDSETGFDYFLARYYSGAQGRFTSPDEFAGGSYPVDGSRPTKPGPLPYADISSPQSLNKYVYALNNPIRYIDPDGHDCSEKDDEKKKRQQQQQQKVQSILVVFGKAGEEQKYMVVFRKFRDRQVEYNVYRVDAEGNAKLESGHRVELRERFVGRAADAKICDSPGSCVSVGSLRDRQIVEAGNVYSVERTWTVDGRKAQVVDPQTGRLADREVLTLSYEKGFSIQYKED